MCAAPLVSVCIPVYNCEKYLGQAIASVLGQTFTDFELVVLDDCSKDKSLEIARGFSDPRLRVLGSAQNLGAEKNWNRCLEEARGEFIKVLCNDDFIEPECLQTQVDALRRNPGAALVCCARTIVDGDGRRIMVRAYPGAGGLKNGRRVVSKCVRWGTNLIGEPPAVLFRSDAARRAGRFNSAQGYMIDLDFWTRLLLEGDLFVQKEALSAFRVATGSWSVNIGRDQARQFKDFAWRLRAEERFGVSGLDCLAGAGMAHLYGFLRRILYRRISASRQAGSK